MKVHLVNPMRNPAGGSEARTVALMEMIGEVENVQIWSEEPPNPAYLGKVPITRIGPPNKFPVGGNLVLVGTYFSIGAWINHAKPARVVVVHNLNQPDRLREVVAALSKLPLPPPEVVYASAAIAAGTPEIRGSIQESPIDIDRFQPRPRRHEGFVVGRMTRDVPEKHHPDDPDLYRRLADAGVKVRLMGATCLGDLGPGIEILPECAVTAEEFLGSLDLFFYRTHPRWLEAYGRVVLEAMATGIPLVAERRHGYAEKLADGVDCVLFDEQRDPFEAILRLRNDPDLHAKIGRNARRTVESLYGDEYRRATQTFYTK